MIRWLLFFSLIVTFPSAGSETEFAILVRGPVKSLGFPLLYPNAIETWSGYYRYLDSEVIVSFTRENILSPNEWESTDCGDIEGFSPNDLSVFYKDNNWSLLFQFPIGDLSADVLDCSFVNEFITRFKYFIRDADPEDPPLLPAILEF